MKTKAWFFGLLLALLFAVGKPAFALQCLDGRNIDGSADSCWTSVVIASNETTLVSRGTVLVLDINNAQADAVRASYQARVATAGTSYYVVGVAQQSIASGASGLILARGKGKLLVQGAVTSGNVVFVSTTAGRATIGNETPKEVGVALSNGTTAEIDAYMTVA